MKRMDIASNRTLVLLLLTTTLVLGLATVASASLNVQLDSGPELGLFLQLPDDDADAVTDAEEANGADYDGGQRDKVSMSTDTTRYFALLDHGGPVTVKASMGPISVRETLYPASYEASETTRPFIDQSKTVNSSSSTAGQLSIATVDTLSAHLVTKEVKRSSPALRVLFYGGHHSNKAKSDSASVDTSSVCAVVSAFRDNEKIFGACSPSNSREGACIAEIVLPASWWPPVDVESSPAKRRKAPNVKVEYIVVRGQGSGTCGSEHVDQGDHQSSEALAQWLGGLPSPLPGGSVASLGEAALLSFAGSYEEVTNDDIVRILVPQEPAFPMSKMHVPVCFRYNPNYPLAAFSVRVRVKAGLRVVGAQLAPGTAWQISTEVSPKQNMATVTAYLRDEELQQDTLVDDDIGSPTSKPAMSKGKQSKEQRKANSSPSQEVFVWLFEVDESAVEFADSGRVVWQVLYITELGYSEKVNGAGRRDFERDSSKLTSRFNIQKDEVQAVVGVTRKRQMLNTAIISGRQVSQSLRVFVVSQSGRPGDVTLQASCYSQDESIVKVSPSCTSVYLDGSEIRGSTNASVLIKYGSFSGATNFVVWMPKLPLDIKISDSKLSQIKGWKTPHMRRKSAGHGVMAADEARLSGQHHRASRNRDHEDNVQSQEPVGHHHQNSVDSGGSDVGCRLRYQQAYVQLTTRFFSSDHDSGRESSLLSRRVSFQVTELGLPFLRVTDPRVALLRGNVLEGLSPGRTEIQVISPITGRVIGAREIKVSADKESITQLEVRLVAGLRLDLRPADATGMVWSAKASVAEKLVSQYQEGLLDAKVHFSDGSIVALADVTNSDYHLSVDIFESGALAYAPTAGLAYPRVVALGQGSGQLLHVSLEVAPQCQRKRTQQLAMTYVSVNVDFSSTVAPTTSVQNDAYFLRRYNGTKERPAKRREGQSGQGSSGNSGLSLRDKLLRRTSQDNSRRMSDNSGSSPSVQQRSSTNNMTPLEVGMYALLAVFSLAVFIFVASCMVFAVRLRGKAATDPETSVITTIRPNVHIPPSSGAPRGPEGPSSTHAANSDKDWVWLGKATLERSTGLTVGRKRVDLNGNPVPEDGSSSTRPSAPQPTVPRRRVDGEGRPLLTLNAPRAVGRDGKRLSAVSYQGSEISIRINPSAAVCDEFDEDVACMDFMEEEDFTESNESTMTGGGETGGHSSTSNRSQRPSVDALVTAGRTGRYRLLVNEGLQRSSCTSTEDDACPVIPAVPQRRHKTTSSTAALRPPPIPPHRATNTSVRPPRPPGKPKRPMQLALPISTVAAATAASPEVSEAELSEKDLLLEPERPPPVPAHTNPRRPMKMSVAKAPPPPVPPHRVVVGGHGVSRSKPKVVDSSRKGDDGDGDGSSSGSEEVEEWERITKNMNYTQLLEYFGNLKESSA